MKRLFFYTSLSLVVAAVSCDSGSNIFGENQFCPRNGRDGRDGRNGVDGRNGRDGVNGNNGIDGKNGIDGVDGLNCTDVNGSNGVDGTHGKDGKDSEHTNWKECAWNNINDDRDIGLVKDCVFKKKSTTTYLKVMITTCMRIYNCKTCCKRWFVTFDGKECSPVPIDGIVYMARQSSIASESNLHRVRTIVGHCKVSKTGSVKVGLNIGNCALFGDSDGWTGWNSSTHIFVEEVVPPQH